MKFRDIIITLLCLTPSLAFAQLAPEYNDMGYFFNQSIYTNPAEEVTINIAPTYLDHTDGYSANIPLFVNYGVTKDFMLSGGITPYQVQHGNGLQTQYGRGEIFLNAQYTSYNINQTNNNLSFVFNLLMPSSDTDRGFNDGNVQYSALLLYAYKIPHDGWNSEFFTQEGFTIPQRITATPIDKSPVATWLLLGAGYAIRSPQVNYSFELNWDNNQWNNHGNENELYFTPGISYETVNKFQLGLGIPIGLNATSDHFQILTYINYNFGNELF